MLLLEPRLRLDITFRDLLAGALAVLRPRRAEDAERAVLAAWGVEDGIVALSARTAFDALLTALDLEWGDEVVFSAITHPDMPAIARAHGATVVPCDLDPETLGPCPESLDEVLGPRTRLVVVAHLFGGRCDVGPIAARVRSVGALVVEDCAQALRGAHDRGDDHADVTIFSFGTIKTATALGGALVRIPEPELRAAVACGLGALPWQRRTHYLARVARCAALVAVGRPLPYGILVRAVAATGRDVDTWVNGLVKAFPPPADADPEAITSALLSRIRQRPCAPLLTLLERRLRRFPAARLAARAEVGEHVAGALPEPLFHPGRSAASRTHWVLPVVARDPDRLVATLRAAGFDGARGTSSIDVVGPPPGREALEPVAARALLRGIVFVPAPPELSSRRRERLIAALRTGGAVQAAAQPTRSSEVEVVA